MIEVYSWCSFFATLQCDYIKRVIITGFHALTQVFTLIPLHSSPPPCHYSLYTTIRKCFCCSKNKSLKKQQSLFLFTMNKIVRKLFPTIINYWSTPWTSLDSTFPIVMMSIMKTINDFESKSFIQFWLHSILSWIYASNEIANYMSSLKNIWIQISLKCIQILNNRVYTKNPNT
jgi:hypothetical protein